MSRRAVLMEAVAATPRDLARTLRPVDDNGASWRPKAEAWSMKETVSHLAAVEALFLARWRRILTEDNPYEAPIEPVRDPDANERTVTELLAEFEQRRTETLDFLASLDQRDWGRPFVHATLGPSRLRDQVQAMVTHDNEHLNQVMALREARDGRA